MPQASMRSRASSAPMVGRGNSRNSRVFGFTSTAARTVGAIRLSSPRLLCRVSSYRVERTCLRDSDTVPIGASGIGLDLARPARQNPCVMASEQLPTRLILGLRALLALLLGLTGFFMVLLAAFLPRASVALIVQLFTGFTLLDGLLCLVAGAQAAWRPAAKVFLLLIGLMEVGVAADAFLLIPRVGERPQVILPVFVVWAVTLGLLELAWAFAARVQRGRAFLVVTALFSIAFGLLAYLSPRGNLMTAVWRFAVYFFLLGVLRLLVTFRAPAAITEPGVAPAVR